MELNNLANASLKNLARYKFKKKSFILGYTKGHNEFTNSGNKLINSTKLIAVLTKSYEELNDKAIDWSSFFNGYLQGWTENYNNSRVDK